MNGRPGASRYAQRGRAALGESSSDFAPQSTIVSWGYVVTGVGFLLLGLSGLKKARAARMNAVPPVTVPGRIVTEEGVGGLGESLDQAYRRTNGTIQKTQTKTVFTIEQRVAEIQRLVREGSVDPYVIEAARAIVSRKCGPDQLCVQPKDYDGEARALFQAIVDPRSPYYVRYTRDHARVDMFFSAKRILQLHAGDCDDLAIVMGAMLASVGAEPELVVIQAGNAPDWSHIFVRVRTSGSDGVSGESGPSGDPRDYLVLDASMQGQNAKPAGWEPPGLTRVLLSGAPSGIVKKAKVFRVRL